MNTKSRQFLHLKSPTRSFFPGSCRGVIWNTVDIAVVGICWISQCAVASRNCCDDCARQFPRSTPLLLWCNSTSSVAWRNVCESACHPQSRDPDGKLKTNFEGQSPLLPALPKLSVQYSSRWQIPPPVGACLTENLQPSVNICPVSNLSVGSNYAILRNFFNVFNRVHLSLKALSQPKLKRLCQSIRPSLDLIWRRCAIKIKKGILLGPVSWFEHPL